MGNQCTKCMTKRKLRYLNAQLSEKLSTYTDHKANLEKELMSCQQNLRLSAVQYTKDEFPDVVKLRIRSLVAQKHHIAKRLSNTCHICQRIRVEIEHLHDSTQITAVMHTLSNVVDYFKWTKEKLDLDDVEECMDELHDLRHDTQEILKSLAHDSDDDNETDLDDVALEQEVEFVLQASSMLNQTPPQNATTLVQRKTLDLPRVPVSPAKQAFTPEQVIRDQRGCKDGQHYDQVCAV